MPQVLAWAKLNKNPKPGRRIPLWVIALVCSIVSFLFLLFSSFDANFFQGSSLRKVYYVDNISEGHLKIIQKFNRLHKGAIEVVPVNLPFYDFTTDDRKEILARALRSRSDGVDIFAVDLIWIPRFAKWAYPMTARFDSASLGKVSKIALEACGLNGSLVAFPLYLDEGVMYYRKDIIRSLPGGGADEKRILRGLTWDEFIKLGGEYQAARMNGIHANGPFYVFPGGEYEGMLCCFQEMLSDEESDRMFHGTGGSADTIPSVSGDGRIELDTKPAERALQTMVDFIHSFKFSPDEVTRFDEPASYIYAMEHNAVFLRGWAGFHTQYRDLLSDTSKIADMDIAPLPHFDGHTTSSVFGGWCLMISKFSERKEEALKFVDFMFQKENQEILYEDGGYLPVNKEVYKDSAFLRAHPRLGQVSRLQKWGRHRPFLENYTELSGITARYLHQALAGEISVKEALTASSNQINAIGAGVK